MHTLTDEEFHTQAEPLLRQIFTGNSPTVEPFTSSITARRILHPCYFTFEEAIPVEALVTAAQEIGDKCCYISLGVETLGSPTHCYIPLSELQEGYAGDTGSEKLIGVQLNMNVYNIYTTIFSGSGRWGIMVVDDGWGLIGGVPEFVNILQNLVPNLEKQGYFFLRSLRNSKFDNVQLTIDWLPGLLSHIYGKEIAEKMIEEAGLF